MQALCCQCITNTLIKWAAAASISSQVASVAASLYEYEFDHTLSDEQKNAYLVQTLGYSASAASLVLAISCSPKAGMSTASGAFAFLAVSVGTGANLWEYFEAKPAVSHITKLAFWSGITGLAGHMATGILAVFSRCCILNQSKNTLLNDAS